MGLGSCIPGSSVEESNPSLRKPYPPLIEKQKKLEKQTTCTLNNIEGSIFEESNTDLLTLDMILQNKTLSSYSHLFDPMARRNALSKRRAYTISTPFHKHWLSKNCQDALSIPREQPASDNTDTESLPASRTSMAEIVEISSSMLECSQSFLLVSRNPEQIQSQPTSCWVEEEWKRATSPMPSISEQIPPVSGEPCSDTRDQSTRIDNAVTQNSYKPFPVVLDISSSRPNTSVIEGFIWSPSKTSQVEHSRSSNAILRIPNKNALGTIEQVPELYETSSYDVDVVKQHLNNEWPLEKQNSNFRNPAELGLSGALVSVSSQRFRSLALNKTGLNHAIKAKLCISTPQKLISIEPNSHISDLHPGSQYHDIKHGFPVPTIVNLEYEESSSDPINNSGNTLSFFEVGRRRRSDAKKTIRLPSSVSSVIVFGSSSTQHSDDEILCLIEESSSNL